jgi:hypothetical protein
MLAILWNSIWRTGSCIGPTAEIRRGEHGQSRPYGRHLMEGIGIALDLKGNRMFVTDLAGSIYAAK